MVKLTPAMLNRTMLKKIQDHAAQIMFLTMDAISLPGGKEQDELVKKIMDHNEAIEEQYSTNWH